MSKLSLAGVVAAVILTGGQHAFSQKGEVHWDASWASPLHFDQNTPVGFEKFQKELAQVPSSTAPVVPPATPPTAEAREQTDDRTVREIVRISVGGSTFRLRLLNPIGSEPVQFDDVHIALQEDGSKIVPESDRTVKFAGQTQVTVQPGVEYLSDPISLLAPNLSHLCVSLYIHHFTSNPSIHPFSLFPVAYASADRGDFAGAREFVSPRPLHEFLWVAGIDVAAEKRIGTVVAMGDSITDAVGAQRADESWPSLLASRLLSHGPKTGVVNVGISGNRLLHDGAGIAGLARLEHDALLQPSAKWLILLEGINDIGFASQLNAELSPDELIAAYRQVVDKAHALGIQVAGCTLLPYKGAGYYKDSGERTREKVNAAIRQQHIFDVVIDLDKAVRDPNDPTAIRDDLQRGDHLHPNAAGYRAMAQAIPLEVFQ